MLRWPDYCVNKQADACTGRVTLVYTNFVVYMWVTLQWCTPAVVCRGGKIAVYSSWHTVGLTAVYMRMYNMDRWRNYDVHKLMYVNVAWCTQTDVLAALPVVYMRLCMQRWRDCSVHDLLYRWLYCVYTS
jgi:hypothetical protein